MTRINMRPPAVQVTDDSSPTRISRPNCATVNRLNYWPAQGPYTTSPNTNDPARRTPKLVATLPAKLGCQPADSESTAQLHPGPAAAIGPGQGCNTVLPNYNDSAQHSPRLAAPLRTKFGGQPADLESSAQAVPARAGHHHRHPATNAKRTATQAYVRRRPSDLPLLNGPSHSKTAADR